MIHSSKIKTLLLTIFLVSFVNINLCAQKKKERKRQLKRNKGFLEREISTNIKQLNFIDGHVHLNDVKMQIQLMKDNNVSQAVVFWGRNSTNESIEKAFYDYPDKFIPFVSISPEREKYRELWKSNNPKLIKILEKELKKRVFKGIGEISTVHFPGQGFPEADFSPLSSSMKEIMKLAEEYKVPVMIHCEITRIKEFSELLNEFKNVKVIWAHGGYTHYFLAKRMIENHSNLYYELSARTWMNHPKSPDYTIFKNNSEIWKQWLNLIETYPNRFILGTDSSNHSSKRDKEKIKSAQLFLNQLSVATIKKISQENLLEIIKQKK